MAKSSDINSKGFENQILYDEMDTDWYGKIRKKAVMSPGELNTLLSYFWIYFKLVNVQLH